MRKAQRLLPIAILTLLAALAVAAIGTAAAATRRPARAHAASSYLVGIGDEQSEMFGNPLWQQLHTRIARYIAPYDAAVHVDSLNRARLWIANAEAQHVQVLVAFYHSEHTPTRLPSVAQYKHDVQKFVRLFPHVRQYQSYDEANRGNVRGAFSSPSASTAAQYYQALLRVCQGCTVIGLDVLDAQNIGPTLTYISEFKHEISKLQTVMPRIWGLHDYSDVNRFESWRTREISQAMGGEVWLTETGGIVQFGGAFPNHRGSGLSRAAKVIKYMFGVAGSQSQVKRLYIYDWTGGLNSTRFDAGLMDSHFRPRQGYVAVCKQLHAKKCNVKVSSH
ncbi:MAG TPA: glycosyl hydrolase [Solirubrobacteraceae bacterium]|nr:glycosyl hydrolase [Solirubrobacteraceae bacterium]